MRGNKKKSSEARSFFSSKYKDEYPDMLIKIMSKGLSYEKFCSKLSISDSTFRDYLKVHSEFKEAYEIGKQKNRQYYMSLARDHVVENKDSDRLNDKLWTKIMRIYHNEADVRKVVVPGLDKAKTLKDQTKCVMSALSSGKLTSQEASSLSSILHASTKVHESEELEKRLEEAERLLSEKADT